MFRVDVHVLPHMYYHKCIHVAMRVFHFFFRVIIKPMSTGFILEME